MTQINYMSSDGPHGFTDRRGGLLTFGVILIILGSLAGCLAALIPVSVVIARTTGASTNPAIHQAGIRQILGAVPVYLLAAVALIWTGIGSIKRRRWVRPIVMIFSAMMIIVGIMSLIGMVLMMPTTMKIMQVSMPPGTALPANMAVFAMVFTMLFGLVLSIGLPALLLWYYRKEDVRLTLEYYDPAPRWTDRCPMPVLGLSLASALAGFLTLLALVNDIMPLFGVLLRGIPAAAILVALSAALLTAAVLIYRRRAAGWWMVVGILVVGAISGGITLVLMDPVELYGAMGLPPEQVEIIADNMMIKPIVAIPAMLISTAAMLGYAVWVKRRYPFEASPSRS